ncbi:hypothetical protein KDU71_07675 [Carboxylicivirga sediminis]|uniref:VRR-NUC domain-containing protein n=1 Tax=Carboxylicivirga sediminis TaxID=2006564 RepID=A0A941F2B2_9BACT|nr:hypothetical protein [Carboxylicivirga sediminis]MBR8535436.1 hypothetical protein [Carboxylicivirga sediminis]
MREENEHEALCIYLAHQYPDVLFNTDLSGVKLPESTAKRVSKLRSSRAYPDLTLYEPRGRYLGLFIELKRTGEVIYKKDGSLRAMKKPIYRKVRGLKKRVIIGYYDHLQEQHEMILKLRQRGYYADFAIGFDKAVKLVDWYLNLEKPVN